MLQPDQTPTKVTAAHGGGLWSVSFTAPRGVTGTLSGYGDPAKALDYGRARGVLVIDWRTASYARCVLAAFAGPMDAETYGRAPDPAPWHSISRAPAWYCAELARLAGATVENAPPIPADAAHLAPTEAFFQKESA